MHPDVSCARADRRSLRHFSAQDPPPEGRLSSCGNELPLAIAVGQELRPLLHEDASAREQNPCGTAAIPSALTRPLKITFPPRSPRSPLRPSRSALHSPLQGWPPTHVRVSLAHCHAPDRIRIVAIPPSDGNPGTGSIDERSPYSHHCSNPRHSPVFMRFRHRHRGRARSRPHPTTSPAGDGATSASSKP